MDKEYNSLEDREKARVAALNRERQRRFRKRMRERDLVEIRFWCKPERVDEIRDFARKLDEEWAWTERKTKA